MENTLFIALSRQLAARRHMDVIANNLANLSTPGYRGEKMMFAEHLSKARGGDNMSFVQDRALAMDTRAGKLSQTGNPLDLAIEGDAWFVVETDAGERYTRNGRFVLDAEGQLVTQNGDPVLTDGGPIQFTAEDTEIVIKADGTVLANGAERGRLSLVSFENEQLLKKESGNLYSTEGEVNPATAYSVVQGTVEESNVQPILQVTEMIKVLRDYQSNQRLIESEHQRQRNAIERLMRQQQG